MGFRGSRVELRPLRGLAPLDRLRRSPALRAGRVKSRRPDWSEDQALQRLPLWGFFFVLPHPVSNAVSFYRLTIRCVGCNTTFLIVSASACCYEVVSTSSVFQPPAAATSFTGYPFRSVAHFRRIECHIPRRCGTIFANLYARRSQSSNRWRFHGFVGSFGAGNTAVLPIAGCAFRCADTASRTASLITTTCSNPFLSCSARQ